MDADVEAELVQGVVNGDRGAFRELVLLHQRPLLAYARRMLNGADAGDDIVQETLLRLWSSAGRYDPGSARLTTWLHRIAHNLCIDWVRRNARVVPMDDDWDVADDSGPAELHEQQRQSLDIRSALDALPERQRAALLLCHYQGLSNRDAAVVLEVSVDALESLLSRARRRLRESVGKHE